MSSVPPEWEPGRGDREREPGGARRRQPSDGSRFVAFLFADLRGFTTYTRAYGADAAAQLTAAFAGLADEAVTDRGGLVVGTWGDEVLAEFPSAREAVRAGLEIQRRCRIWTVANPGAPLAVGIGLDVGEPADAEDLRASEALDLAARLCATARAGEVLASRELMHLAGGMRGEVTGKLRRLRLKGIGGRTEAVSVRQRTRDEELERRFHAVLAGLPTARRRRRQRALIAAATVAAVVAGGLAWWLASSAPNPARPRIPGQALGAIDVRTGQLIGTLPLTGSPVAVAASPDGRQVWVTEPAAGAVVGVDASTRHVFETISGLSDPRAVAIAYGYVWVVDAATGTVHQYTATGQAIGRPYDVGNEPSAIASGFGALWVTNEADGTLTRIAAETGKIHTIPVGASPSAVVAGDREVWVANRKFNSITSVDPRTLHPAHPITVGAGPASIAATQGRIWVADALDGTLDRIVPLTGAVTGAQVGQLPAAVAAGAGGIWVGSAVDATVARIDPHTGQPIGHPLYIGSAPTGLALTGSTLWVATQPYPRTAHRGGTLTIADPRSPDGDLIDTIDPAGAYLWSSWSAVELLYDGLVGWNRQPGVASTQLVPDLAVALPNPSDGGRTYRFVLRRGIRFSNGTPLRASDISRGLKRTILAPGILSGYFADIIGAAGCPGHPPGQCDLSEGIQTNDAAGTVTFHLARPDPDFLAKLAIGEAAAAVPPGTPMHVPQTEPIPGTGPYKVLTYVPSEHGRPAELTLVRNPHFPQNHPWSVAAQPAGYVNEIRWVPEPTMKAAVAATLAGRVDVAYPDISALDMLTVAQRARQLHIPVGSGKTNFVVLNAAVPPFNNPTARRAAAYALTADPGIARIMNDYPACTFVPPHYPGYSPGCAYRRNLAKARQLVIKSGTAGESVHVYNWTAQPFADLGRHIRRVFQQIGYRADLRLEQNYPHAWPVYGPHRPVNVEGLGWAPDFYSVSQFYEPMLGCRKGAFRQLGSCNRSIDALATRALRLGVTAPSTAEGLWRRVYRRVDADARIIPTDGNPGVVALLSTQTGNYSPNATDGGTPLLDQLWVR